MYLSISSWTLRLGCLSSEGRDLLLSADANCAQMGVSAGSTAESGGVVFSFPCGCACCCGAYERSLLDRFILPNMAEMLVLDLLFFILLLSVFVGEREP